MIQEPERPSTGRAGPAKLLRLVASLLLFVLAIELLQIGAAALGPVLRSTRLEVTGIADGIGLGWLLSYAILSGSPAASCGLALLGAGVLDSAAAFGVIVGSRFGASLIVLLVGLAYILRGRDPVGSMAMGLVAVGVAFSQQLVALPLGVAGLSRLPSFGDATRAGSSSASGLLVSPMLEPVPRWLVFIGGLILVLVSLRLFDAALPQMRLDSDRRQQVQRLVSRRWSMFLLGAAITVVTLSVGVSLGLLVPLHLHGRLDRGQAIPYILGANISTFSDTLLAGLLIGHPAAVPIVLVEMLTLCLASLCLLGPAYRPYRRMLLAFSDWAAGTTRNLSLVALALFILPLALLLL